MPDDESERLRPIRPMIFDLEKLKKSAVQKTPPFPAVAAAELVRKAAEMANPTAKFQEVFASALETGTSSEERKRQSASLVNSIGGGVLHRLEEQQQQAAHEKAEGIAREKATLATLQAIQRELEEERKERERLAETVNANEEELARYRTGAPGRPGSRHLLIAEFQRRAAAGALEGTLASQARVMVAWLKANHPSAPPVTEKSAENILRDEYRRAKQRV